MEFISENLRYAHEILAIHVPGERFRILQRIDAVPSAYASDNLAIRMAIPGVPIGIPGSTGIKHHRLRTK